MPPLSGGTDQRPFNERQNWWKEANSSPFVQRARKSKCWTKLLQSLEQQFYLRFEEENASSVSVFNLIEKAYMILIGHKLECCRFPPGQLYQIIIKSPDDEFAVSADSFDLNDVQKWEDKGYSVKIKGIDLDDEYQALQDQLMFHDGHRTMSQKEALELGLLKPDLLDQVDSGFDPDQKALEDLIRLDSETQEFRVGFINLTDCVFFWSIVKDTVVSSNSQI